MNAWFALTKKELQLVLPAFLVALILFAGVLSGGYFFGNYVGFTNEILLGASSFTLAMHPLLLVIYLYYSLNTERKRLHLWLHNPMSIQGLLSAKLITGIIYMSVTFIFSMISTIYFTNTITDFFAGQTMMNVVVTVASMIIASSLFLAAVFLFYWSIFLTFSQQMNDFLSFVLTFIIFLVISWAYNQFMDLAFIDSLTKWGEIHLQDIVGFELNFIVEDYTAETHGGPVSDTAILYIGEFVKELIAAAVMFFAASWIIERKVEV